MNEVDADGPSHDQKKNRHVAVNDNLAFGDQTEKSGAKAGGVGFQHMPNVTKKLGKASELARDEIGVGSGNGSGHPFL